MGLSAERRAELKRKGAVEMSVEDWLGLDEVDRQVVEFRFPNVVTGRWTSDACSSRMFAV